eukprot:gene1707-138_t
MGQSQMGCSVAFAMERNGAQWSASAHAALPSLCDINKKCNAYKIGVRDGQIMKW